jgi:hypothetical protein
MWRGCFFDKEEENYVQRNEKKKAVINERNCY